MPSRHPRPVELPCPLALQIQFRFNFNSISIQFQAKLISSCSQSHRKWWNAQRKWMNSGSFLDRLQSHNRRRRRWKWRWKWRRKESMPLHLRRMDVTTNLASATTPATPTQNNTGRLMATGAVDAVDTFHQVSAVSFALQSTPQPPHPHNLQPGYLKWALPQSTSHMHLSAPVISNPAPVNSNFNPFNRSAIPFHPAPSWPNSIHHWIAVSHLQISPPDSTWQPVDLSWPPIPPPSSKWTLHSIPPHHWNPDAMFPWNPTPEASWALWRISPRADFIFQAWSSPEWTPSPDTSSTRSQESTSFDLSVNPRFQPTFLEIQFLGLGFTFGRESTRSCEFIAAAPDFIWLQIATLNQIEPCYLQPSSQAKCTLGWTLESNWIPH